METLNVKEFDTEFDVDPLFRKTSAEFDEGGAGGLLLNHLSVHGNCKLIFDSSDLLDEKMETTPDFSEKLDYSVFAGIWSSYHHDFCSHFHTMLDSSVALLQTVFQRTLCPSMESLRAGLFTPAKDSGIASTQVDLATQIDELDEESSDDETDHLPSQMSQGHSGLGDDPIDDGGFGLGDSADEMQGVEPLVIPHSGSPVGASVSTVPEPRSNMNLSFDLESNEYSYFTQALTKNWAGPEHWKLRRLPRDTNAESTLKKSRKEKTAVTIDFINAASVDTSSLFKTSTAINLPLGTIPEFARSLRGRWLLPKDIHFSTQEFLQLFSKPRWTLKATVQPDGHASSNGEFWANLNHVDGGTFGPTVAVQGAVTDLGLDLGTQADGGFDDDFDGIGGDDIGPESPGKMHLISPLKKIEKYDIKYAKTAKRVDVKLLKENVWTALTMDRV